MEVVCCGFWTSGVHWWIYHALRREPLEVRECFCCEVQVANGIESVYDLCILWACGWVVIGFRSWLTRCWMIQLISPFQCIKVNLRKFTPKTCDCSLFISFIHTRACHSSINSLSGLESSAWPFHRSAVNSYHHINFFGNEKSLWISIQIVETN